MAHIAIKYQKQNVLNFAIKFHHRIYFYFIQHQKLFNIRERGINCTLENCAVHQKENLERTEAPWCKKLLFSLQKGGSIFQIFCFPTNTESHSA